MTIQDFILCADNALSGETCKRVIDYFAELENAGLAQTRQQQNSRILKLHMDDTSACVGDVIGRIGFASLFNEISSVLWSCVQEYVNKYDALKNAAQLSNYDTKIQKTNVGGGYHIWHFETDSRATSGRVLTYIFYVNDVEEGGETEFLYIPKRINAKEGRLVLFPGSFTHTHRGNQPLSNEKYVITGFVEY